VLVFPGSFDFKPKGLEISRPQAAALKLCDPQYTQPKEDASVLDRKHLQATFLQFSLPGS